MFSLTDLYPFPHGLHIWKVEAGATEVAVFGSASETFSKKNINCSIKESMLRFKEVISSAKQAGIPVRGWAQPPTTVNLAAWQILCAELLFVGHRLCLIVYVL